MEALQKIKAATLAGILASSLATVTGATTGVTPSGGEYRILSSITGDQLLPQLSFNATGGYLVTQDNSIDGSGLGIRGRRFSSDLSGDRFTFQVNSNGKADQQNARVAVQGDGGAVFVWESSEATGHRVYIRFMDPTKIFRSTDVPVSTLVIGSQSTPAVAVLTDGTVVAVWSELNRDGSMQGIFGQRFSGTGSRIGESFQINQVSALNQRNPVIAPLSNGNFVVAWVSEEARTADSIDVYARVFDRNAQPQNSEFRLNEGENICANPYLAATSGGFRAAWSSRALKVDLNSWDVATRSFGLTGAAQGPTEIANTTTKGDQFSPRVSSIGNRDMIVWTSYGQDGADEGVYARVANFPSGFEGDEFRVNTTTRSKQMQPAITAVDSSRFVVAWTSFGGGITSFDLWAQQYTLDVEQTLPQPSAPFVSAGDQHTLIVSWGEMGAQNVAEYLIYVDGSTTPIVGQDGLAIVSNLQWLPQSTHTVQLAYRLGDGRVSPASASVSCTTWGADLNGDGVPDDWQSFNWGKPINWPNPALDSDGDGASNLAEFLAGTDPTNPDSVLKVVISTREQGPYVEWTTEPGSVYQLQISSDLKTWQNVGTQRFASSTSDAIPASQPGQGQYYRVIRMR